MARLQSGDPPPGRAFLISNFPAAIRPIAALNGPSLKTDEIARTTLNALAIGVPAKKLRPLGSICFVGLFPAYA